MRISTIFFLFLIWFNVKSQDKLLQLHQLTPREGLSQSDNRFLHIDHEGYVWISSLDGLNLFNGSSIKVLKNIPNDSFSIKGINIQSPFFEAEKDIWFATDEGVNVYKRKTDRFDNFQFSQSEKVTIHHLFHLDKSQYLWGNSLDSLYSFDILNSKPTALLGNFSAPIGDLVIDRSNHLKKLYKYGVKNGIGVYHFSDQNKLLKQETYFDKPNLPSKEPLFFYDLVIENENVLWLRSDDGLVRWDSSNPLDFLLISPPAHSGMIKDIFPYQDSLIWVLTTKPCLLLYDIIQKQFLNQTFSLSNNDLDKQITKIDEILALKDSVLWLSDIGHGIYYTNIASQRISSLHRQKMLGEHKIYQITKTSSNRIYATSETGEAWFFDQNKENVTLQKVPVFSKQLLDIEGTAWNLSRFQGLSFLESKTQKLKNAGIPVDKDDIFFDIAEYNINWLLLGTSKGLLFLNKNNLEITTTSSSPWIVNLFLDSEGRIWTANAGGALSVWNVQFQNNKPQLQKLKEFNNLGLLNHLTEDKSRNGIWVGTSEGLLLIDIYSLEIKQRITEADGLPNQSIYAIAIDDQQHLWLSSNKGIIRYAPDEVAAERFRNFTSRDGLSSDEYSPGAVYVADNGEIWFGSTKGVDVFHPDDMRRIGKAPQLAISSLKIHDKEWKGEFAINATEHIEFSHKDNSLTFDLAAMEYTDPLRNQFKVFLEHQGRVDTTHLGTKNSITYANLSPGDYTFSFTACNSEGIWQQVPKSLSFYIIPPLHQRPWFQALIAGLALALVGFISALYYRYQLRAKEIQLLTKEKENLELGRSLILVEERIRIARDMHDQLGSGLSRIQNLGLRTSRKEDSVLLKKGLQKIADLSRNLKKNMRELIWAMSAENDSLDALMGWTRLYVMEYLGDNGLRARTDLPEEVPDVVMNGRYRYNIILVIKEALHNVVKSAEAQEVFFQATIGKDNLQLCIQDDGKGFVYQEGTAALGKNIGLRSMKERITSIGGTIEWNSTLGEGTEVCIDLPLRRQTVDGRFA